MKVLLTGANGFLGHYLTAQLLGEGHHVIGIGRKEWMPPFSGDPWFAYTRKDITDERSVASLFKHQPDIVIHAAAMTRPDDCERDPKAAFAANVSATEYLLKESARLKAKFIYVSTDFVFDGIKGMYSETDEPSPVNYYGQTKLSAERSVMAYPFGWTIARTVLVYGRPFLPRPNLLCIIRQKLEKGEKYNVVNDQLRTPTYVEDLANGITAMINREVTGIYHLSGPELMTPYQMAVRTANYLGYDASLICEVNADNFKEPARRPRFTGFNIDKARKELGYDPLSFNEGLKLTFDVKG